MAGQIFLVDDERPVLDGVSAAIRKRMPDVEIVGTAISAREAIEGVTRLRPDVVLMDVRMSGMSGLEALRELKASAPDTVPVLLTAYERFDVAKEAFGLGVYDYLVKPIDQDLLVKAVRGALDAASARKAEAARVRDALEALARQRLLLEEGLIYAAIVDPSGSRIHSFAEALALPSDSFCLAALGRHKGNLDTDDKEALRAALSYQTACAVGAPLSGLIPVFFPCDPSLAAMVLSETLSEPRFSEISAGLGPSVSPEEGSSSWMGALSALSGAPAGVVIGAGGPTERPASTAAGHMKAALEAASRGDAAGAITSWAAMPEGEERDRILKTATAGAAAWVLRRDTEALAELSASLAEGTIPPNAFSQARGLSGYGASAKVAMALRYIGERYADPLSLELVAEQVGLSPAHLSRVLSAETGRSFKEHLSDIRISRAKVELDSGRFTVKEVGAAVGYRDPNYFSRVFKRATGMTPLEYEARNTMSRNKKKYETPGV